MQSLSTHVMILLAVVFSLAAVTYFGSSITGMATTGTSTMIASSTLSDEQITACGSPCWDNGKLGAKTLLKECVEVERYMLSKYCCFDDDCSKGQVCVTKTGTCAGTAPVAKIQHFKEGILGISPVIDKITKDNGKINILFVPDKSYKDALSPFYTDISLYMSDLMSDLVQQLSLESGYTKEQLVGRFNILYIEEMADCHEDKSSSGGFSCERSVVEQTPEYKNGMLDMIAVLIKPGTRFGDIVRSHAHRNVLVADSALEFRHEIGHLFGLADEYGDDGFYFTVASYPNVWATPEACLNMEGWAPATQECEQIGGTTYYHRKASQNIMSDQKNYPSYGMGIYRIKYVLDNLYIKKEIFKEIWDAMIRTGQSPLAEFMLEKCTYTTSSGLVNALGMAVCNFGYQNCAVCVLKIGNQVELLSIMSGAEKKASGVCVASGGKQRGGMLCIRNCQCESGICDMSNPDPFTGYGACKSLYAMPDEAWPAKSDRITTCYGWRTHPVTGEKNFHTGMDIGLDSGYSSNAAIMAAFSGTIEQVHSSSEGAYGKYVIVKHVISGHTIYTLYGHLSSIAVAKGQTVAMAQKIGVMGSTGLSTTTHLHFQVAMQPSWSRDAAVNPCDYFACSLRTKVGVCS